MSPTPNPSHLCLSSEVIPVTILMCFLQECSCTMIHVYLHLSEMYSCSLSFFFFLTEVVLYFKCHSRTYSFYQTTCFRYVFGNSKSIDNYLKSLKICFFYPRVDLSMLIHMLCGLPILTAVDILPYKYMKTYLSASLLRDIWWFPVFHKNKHFCS